MDIGAAREAIDGTTPVAEHLLRPVAPQELARYWPLVRPGLEKVRDRSGDGWLVEDIYVALKQGVSELYVGLVSQYYVGCVVLTPTVGWHGPQAHLWAVYSRGERDVLEAFLPDLVERCRARGITRLTMSSERKGWLRRAEQLGFRPTQQHYTLEV